MSEIGGGEIIQRLIHPDRERHLAIEREATAPLDVAELRRRLRMSYIVHPDDSHGQPYVNRGLVHAIRIVAMMADDIDGGEW